MRTCEIIYANEIRERMDTQRNPYQRICKNRKVLSCDGPTLVEMSVHDDDDDDDGGDTDDTDDVHNIKFPADEMQ